MEAIADPKDLVRRSYDQISYAYRGDMEENHEPMPQPLATKRYSGRFMVRVPPELHRRLALEAAEAGVSLNRLASKRLTVTASSTPSANETRST